MGWSSWSFLRQHPPPWPAGGAPGLDIECYSCEKSGSSYPLASWGNVASRFDAVARWQPYGGPHGWNDEDGIAARRVIEGADEQVFAKRQPGGVWYAGVFNSGTSAPRTFRVPLEQLGLSGAVKVTDLWTGRSLGVVSGSYTTTVAPGGVSLISAGPA